MCTVSPALFSCYRREGDMKLPIIFLEDSPARSTDPNPSTGAGGPSIARWLTFHLRYSFSGNRARRLARARQGYFHL
jgi:hypothetical protein